MADLCIPRVDTAELASRIAQKKTTLAIERVEDAMIATVAQVNSTVSTVQGFAPKLISDPLVSSLRSEFRSDSFTAEAVTKLAPSLNKVRQVTAALTAVAQTHPIIGIVVGTLTALFQLELQRRQNNAKAIALCNQVADTVSILKDLKKVEDESGLKKVLIAIADHIRGCEEFLTLYTTKGTMLRILKSMSYNDKMKDLAQAFDDDKKLLSETLQRCAVLGIDAANEKLDNQSSKLDDILAILNKRSAEEIAASKFADRHGVKLEDVPASDNLLRRLALEMNVQSTNVRELRSQLNTSLESLLETNREEFMAAFDAQTRQINKGLDKILTAVESGPWQNVEHPDMQLLWRQERWKGTVPRHVFMEALSSFYEEFYSRFPTAAGATCAGWITSQHWAAMAECIDVDESGYIGIKELNVFTAALPYNWTLPSWFAYVGIGDKIRMTHDYQVAEQFIVKLEELAAQGGANAEPLSRFLKKANANVYALGRLWCWTLGPVFPLPDETEEAEKAPDEAEYSDDDLDNLESPDEEDNTSAKDQMMGESLREFMSTRDAKIKNWLMAHNWTMSPTQYEDLRGDDPADTHNGSLNAIVKIVIQQLYKDLTAEPTRTIPPSHFLAMRRTLKTVFWEYRNTAKRIYEQWCNQRKDPLHEVRFYCNGLFREWIARCHRDHAFYYEADAEEDEEEETVDAITQEAVPTMTITEANHEQPASEPQPVDNGSLPANYFRQDIPEYIPGYTLKPKPSIAKVRDVQRLQAETHELSSRLQRIEVLLTEITQERQRGSSEEPRDLADIVRQHTLKNKKKNKGFKWASLLK